MSRHISGKSVRMQAYVPNVTPDETREKVDYAEVSWLCKRTRRVSRICSFPSSVALILQYDVERVDDARNVSCRKDMSIIKLLRSQAAAYQVW
jgi:hypothetical protein